EARHIPSALLRSAGRRRKAAARNQINGFGWQMQSLAPALKFLQTHCIPPQLLVNHSLQGRKESRRQYTRRGPFTMKEVCLSGESVHSGYEPIILTPLLRELDDLFSVSIPKYI